MKKAQKPGVRSTKTKVVVNKADDDLAPQSKQRDIMVVTYDLEDELQQKIATDQTGNMPKKQEIITITRI